MAHGQMLFQWMATGYHIAMMFSAEGKMLRITHESAHFYAPPPPPGCLGLVILFAVIALTIICTLLASFFV